MFERGRDIRAAKLAELRAKAWREGYAEGYKRGLAEARMTGRMDDRIADIELVRERARALELWALLVSRGVALPPEVADAILGGGGKRRFGARRFWRRVSG